MKVLAFRHQFQGALARMQFSHPDLEIVDWFDNPYPEADHYIQCNINCDKFREDPVFDFVASSGKPYMIFETAVFKRQARDGDWNTWHWRLGWWHLLSPGKFNNENSPSDRWERIKQQQRLEVLPWRKSGTHILIPLQKNNDSVVQTMMDRYGSMRNWLNTTIQEIRKYSDRPILIRPSLKTNVLSWSDAIRLPGVTLSTTYKDNPSPDGTKFTRNIEGGPGLLTELADAWAVVGYNTSTLFESITDGIPTVSLDPDALTGPCSMPLHLLENPPMDIDRTQWLYDMAYISWTMDELQQGVAWEHLKGKY
jgi:hypothetical protein